MIQIWFHTSVSHSVMLVIALKSFYVKLHVSTRKVNYYSFYYALSFRQKDYKGLINL